MPKCAPVAVAWDGDVDVEGSGAVADASHAPRQPRVARRGWRGRGEYTSGDVARPRAKNLRDAEIIAGALTKEGCRRRSLRIGIRERRTRPRGWGRRQERSAPGGGGARPVARRRGVSDAARNIAAHAAPVNPRANAAREAARAKRLAMMKATATATAEARTADDEDATG